MSKVYHKKEGKLIHKKFLKGAGILFFLIGAGISLYIFSPLVLWQMYSAGELQNITTPIPRSTVVNPSMVGSLIASAKNSIAGVDYTNAQNWFPGYKASASEQKSLSYTMSIPAIDIKNAIVSTSDYDLSKHLVNYQGTSTPGNLGNSVIFGHSTLPRLFDPTDYKTIFAKVHNLKVGDQIFTTTDSITYKYKIFNIYIIDAEDTSVFAQTYDNSYLTLVTCTPPGTIWKRLIIKARLERI